jgi:protein-tyrosine phosphatase
MAEIAWINDKVAVGPSHSFGGPSLEELMRAGVSVIVDLNADPVEGKLATKLGMQYWGVYVQDHTAPTQEQLLRIAAIVEDAVAAGRKVYVHCTAGVGRSPTCVAAYLIATGRSFEEATAEVKAKRRVAWTDSGARDQLQALRVFQSNMGKASTKRTGT